MRATSLLAASAAMLVSAAALAQQAPPSGGAINPHPPGLVTAPRPPAPDPLQQTDVSKLDGAAVIGSDGQQIGDISTVLMRPQDRRIDRLVVHTGGVLGIGGRYVAMPVGDFTWDGVKNAFVVAKTLNDVKYMANWHAQPATPPVETGSSEPSGHAAVPPNNAGK
jgi:sporulation protein YlmC with PRC-barrel domain